MFSNFIMSKKFFVAFASCLLLSVCSFAQIPSQLIFNRITKNDGLASNTTFQTVRDKKGYLWIATQNGLQRFDGNRFLTFRHVPGNVKSISKNSVDHLFLDSRERLWILFDQKLGLFSTTNFDFQEVKVNAPFMMIKKMVEDQQGKLILFADSKQFLYNETKQEFDSVSALPPLPEGYTVNDMAVDPSTGFYWLTGKQGSMLYDPKTKKYSSKERNNSHEAALDNLGPITNARYPFIANDGNWWVVNWIPFSGPAPILFNYDKKNNKVQRFEKIRSYKADSYYEIWRVFQQSNGTIWVHGMGLLAYYNKEENRFIHIKSDPFQQYGINYDYVTDLYEDKEKNVWVCTNEGLYRFNVEAQVFRNISNARLNDTTETRNAVSSILQTKNNGIWVSTWGGGIFSYNDTLQPIANPFTTADPLNKSLHAGAMIQRRNGEIWVGTHDGHLKIYKPATGEISTVSPSQLTGQHITQLFEDHAGNTWIGSSIGVLVKCEKGNWYDTAHSYKTILSDLGDVFKLYQDHRNNLWICTSSNGLHQMDATTGTVIKKFNGDPDKKAGLLNNGASDIVQYNDSTYLIASEGLCILDSKTNLFKYLTPADGIPAEHITNLIIDKQNRLWVACDGGLYRLNIENNLYITYDAADGITNDVFQVAAARLLNNGQIAIGTPHDFLVFDPGATIDKKEVPPVQITGFTLGTDRLPVDSLLKLERLVLPYDNTFIRIELSTLAFRDNYYMYYMIDELDKTWKRVSNNEITYQYLPPGQYTLRLKSQNGEGAESKSITVLNLQITPPFWKTWWFYSVIGLLIGGILFWLDNARIKRRTAVLKMRSEIADDLHQDIDATLSSITILSTMAKMKADNEPERSKEFINEIHTKSQNMTTAMGEILWSIDPGNDSMEKFMSRYREFVDNLKLRYHARVDVRADRKAEKLHFKMEVRNDLFWLFKDTIINVIQAGVLNCVIHVSYEKPYLIYTLEFDGTSVDIKQLETLHHRDEFTRTLKRLQAKLDFNDHKANAELVLKIPMRREGILG